MELIKRLSLVMVAALFAVAATGCGGEASGQANVANAPADAIALQGSSISCQLEGVQVDGSRAVITQPGTYTITGSLDDGQIAVNITNGESATLILDNASISCSNSSPLYIQEAGDVTIMLADGSQNTINDGNAYEFEGGETEPDAAIFSKADLVIEGGGTLTVNGYYNDGIASRDTLLIKGGNINVNAATHGIKGKDYLMVEGGAINVEANGDGLKATNNTQAAMGYVHIKGGEISVKAGDEGISGVSSVTIEGGNIAIDCEKSGLKSEDAIELQGGEVSINTGDDAVSCLGRQGQGAARLTINGRDAEWNAE